MATSKFHCLRQRRRFHRPTQLVRLPSLQGRWNCLAARFHPRLGRDLRFYSRQTRSQSIPRLTNGGDGFHSYLHGRFECRRSVCWAALGNCGTQSNVPRFDGCYDGFYARRSAGAQLRCAVGFQVPQRYRKQPFAVHIRRNTC